MWKPTDLAILVPVLGRPQNIEPTMESAERATPGARVLFLADPGDHKEIEALKRHGADWMVVDGNYARKINTGAKIVSEPLLFLGADDLAFHAGWFRAAVAELHDGIGVVGTNDLCNRRVMRGEHSTHSLVARWYIEEGTIDEPGRLLHEGYPHEYVDDEFVQTARSRGRFAHAAGAIVEHLHPQVGKAPMDRVYALQRRRMIAGKKIYRQRRRLWTRR